ncbi:MAG: hypothetical protein IJI03_12475 [Rudaea sp.]|nr:hypothetical protein [Rudaea sp.]
MRIEIDGGVLHDTLCAATYKARSTLPILGFALLDATGDRVRVTTTDLEAFFAAELPAKVPMSGRICVNVELLKAAARDGNLSLLHNADSSIMQATPKGGSKLRLPVLKAEDFPEPDEGTWQPITINPVELADAIRSVKYAAARSDIRAYLNCVGVVPGCVGASDGHRAAKFDIAYDGPELPIPQSQIDGVLALLGPETKLSATLNAANNASLLRVENGSRTLIVRLIDCRMPKYAGLFVGIEQTERRAQFDRIKLLQAVKQFSPFTGFDGTNKAMAKGAWFIVADGAAKIESGESEENCSWALGHHEGGIRFSLCMPYLTEALAAIDTEKVSIGLMTVAGNQERLSVEPIIPGDTPAPQAHIIVGITL